MTRPIVVTVVKLRACYNFDMESSHCVKIISSGSSSDGPPPHGPRATGQRREKESEREKDDDDDDDVFNPRDISCLRDV